MGNGASVGLGLICRLLGIVELRLCVYSRRFRICLSLPMLTKSHKIEGSSVIQSCQLRLRRLESRVFILALSALVAGALDGIANHLAGLTSLLHNLPNF